MKTVQLSDGPARRGVPALGQGTWRMGENKNSHADEVAALRLGIDLGMTLIDTAEMYGEGGAEKVVADAIAFSSSRKYIRTTRHAPNCRKRVSAVSGVSASRSLTFIYYIGVATYRSRRPWRLSRTFDPAGKFDTGAFQTSTSKT
jgi:diketogulonate reductase-like aldo/keto reductase